MGLEGERGFWKKARVKLAGVLAGLALLGYGCGKTEEERCCECLVEQGCSSVGLEQCVDAFYVFEGVARVRVDSACVGENDCYLTCAAGGAYFENGEMVVDYWKRKGLGK